MAYALVRSEVISATNVFANSTTYAYPYPASYTNGNLLAIIVIQETRTVTGIAGATLTYTGGSSLNASAGFSASLYTVIGNGSADTTATITLSGAYNGTNTTIVFMEFSGAQADQSGNVTSSNTVDAATSHPVPNTGTITPPTAVNVVLFGGYISGGVYTADADFTMIAGTPSYASAGYLIQAAATAQNFVGSTDVNRYTALRLKACAGASGGGGASAPVFVHQLKQQGIA